MSDIYLSRQPLVNHQSRIMAIRLSLHAIGKPSARDAVHALTPLLEHWLYGKRMVFIDPASIPYTPQLFDWPIPENTMMEVPPSALVGPESAPLVEQLKTLPISLVLVYDDDAEKAALTGVRFRFVNFDAKRYPPDQLKGLLIKTRDYGLGVAYNVYDAASFQACIDAGINAASSWFFKLPDRTKKAKSLNPAQANIIRVLNLVRKNADVQEIEEALKQDIAISYKLLRYINSVGFGLSCEVQSFRHAVTILGYEKLNKWLSLLLVTASKAPMAQALMYTALTRARLMELLGSDLIDPQEQDNLFITGAFSLLDALLGVDMEQVLETMTLPSSICDALLGQEGVYSPFLNLTKTSEGEDGQAIADQAAMLGLTAQKFNVSQMQALSFADRMDF
ncbi:MAG: HDOD domain-containing protein [Candidatus Accumulibacter sp.]|jgi:EAL and modified HD-GYP domain-containing signal transduction protein|nr:HDOD domain-containing protein [Accumulibacter sp.]